jgi:hypothetical protein
LRRSDVASGAAPELAGSAIGVLLANGHIDVEQAHAAGRYAWLRAVLFGIARPSVASDLGEPWSPILRADARLAKIREVYERLCSRLGRDQKQQIDLLMVDNRLPSWFRQGKLGYRLTAEDEAEREALLGGLAALAARR